MELTEIPSKPRSGPYEAVDTYDNEGLDSSVRPRPAPKPRSWRRIGLIIITGLILLGVPLFIWLQVRSSRTCVWVEWAKPEFLPDDVHLLPIDNTTVGVFWSLTNSQDQICKKLWLEQASQTEYVSVLKYQVFTFNNGEWSGHGVKDLSDNEVLGANLYIVSMAKLSSGEFVILTQSYEDTWGLYRIGSPDVATSIQFTLLWNSTQPDFQVYELVQFADGSTYLMNESAADQAPQPSLMATPVTSTGFDRTKEVAFGIGDLVLTTTEAYKTDRAVYWWTVGTTAAVSADNPAVKQVYVGYGNFSNGAERFFFKLCSLGDTTKACQPALWNPTDESATQKQLLLIDVTPEGVTRYLITDQDPNFEGSSVCQWFAGATTPPAAPEPWAAEYCISRGQFRQVDNTTWVRADAKLKTVQTYSFSVDLLKESLAPTLGREPAPLGELGIELMSPFTPDAVPNIPSRVNYTSTFMSVLLNPRFYHESNVLYYYKQYPVDDDDFDFDTSIVQIQGPAAPPNNTRN